MSNRIPAIAIALAVLLSGGAARAYEANAKVITTSDQILQDLNIADTVKVDSK